MYQNNVHISLILIIVFIILVFLISIQYSIGLAQTNDNFNPAPLVNKGNALYESGRYEEAIEYYDRVLQIEPNRVSVLFNKGASLSALGRYQEAITYYDRVLQIEPNHIKAFQQKQLALDSLDNIPLSTKPNNVFALNNKGVALYELERYQEAIEYYDRALEIEPNHVNALINKGVALDNLGRYEEAISYYDRALEIEPNFVPALNGKGNALNSLGRYEEAIEYYDRALGSKPIEDVQYSMKDLKTELDYNSVSQPMKFIDSDGYKEFRGLQYIGISQDSETIIIITVNKGIAYYKAGKYDMANDNFDRVLGMDSDYVAALHYKGLCLEKLGQPDQAVSYKNRAKAIDPTYKGELIDIVLTQSPLEQLFDTDTQ